MRGRGPSDGCGFEQLENRVLLDAADFSVGQVEWYGAEMDAVPGSWLLTFETWLGIDAAATEARSIASQLGVSLTSVQGFGRGHYAEIRTPDWITEDQVEQIVADSPLLKGINPNFVDYVARTPNDGGFAQQYPHLNTGQDIPGLGVGLPGADMNTTEAWDVTVGTSDVIIAINDTGIDLQHPDLVDNLWINPNEIPDNGIDDDGNGFIDDIYGWDTFDGDNDPDDVMGHGTAVAGTVGAVGDNLVGVAGVMWDVKMIAMKIFGSFGGTPNFAQIMAHDYLTDLIERGTNVVASNNSYGAVTNAAQNEFNVAARTAIENFINAGGVFVAAAGNDGTDLNDVFEEEDRENFPSGYDLEGIVAVAATDNRDQIADFSNYGVESVDLGAPGVAYLTTANGGGYTYINGTSFASPAVAGVVGLMASIRPDVAPDRLREVLNESVDVLPGLTGRTVSDGRVNAAEALRIVQLEGPAVTVVTPSPVTADEIDTITVAFNKQMADIYGDTLDNILDPAGATLLRVSNSSTIDVLSITLADDGRSIDILLDVDGFSRDELPVGTYRLTLDETYFKDIDGNFLNGDATSGEPETYEFEVVNNVGKFEANDAIPAATNVNFTSSGTRVFENLLIGDGVTPAVDVDMFAISIPKAGRITARIDARSLGIPSTLDSYLRLFNGSGIELASNDQFFGPDSFIDYFVPTGGTYYIGVSGFPNTRYLPAIAGSGTGGTAVATGNYDITIDVELIGDESVVGSREYAEGAEPRIPAQGSGGGANDFIESTISITDSRQVRDVNVVIDLEHTFVSDLVITLIAPTGEEVVLFNNNGGANEDLAGITFDDEGTASIAAYPTTGILRYTPFEPLSRVDGIAAVGDWTLRIADTSQLNSGMLNSWQLDLTVRSDIFGAFELNDTLATATNLQNIQGTGAQLLTATLGDGGFGVYDRDIYSFVASAGSTLNVDVISTSNLDAAVRLFDAVGDEILLDSPTDGLDAGIGNFVFIEGGTYYLGVSEASNVDYDLFVVSNANEAATTGSYALGVSVAPGVGEESTAHDANIVDAGLTFDGTFGGNTGISVNGREYLLGGGATDHFYGGTADGYFFRNDGTQNADALPVALADQSDATNQRAIVEGRFRDLDVERSVSWGVGDSFIAFDVFLTNAGGDAIESLSWIEAFDPRQGAGFNGGDATFNDILGETGDFQPYAASWATSTQFPDGLTMALAAPAADGRATVTYVDPLTSFVRDASILLQENVLDPQATSGDLTMAIAFDLGMLDVGETVAVRYFLFFGNTPEEAMALYDQVNDGTGTGHLAADSANPASETLSDGTETPDLPYRLYYPEGFSNEFIYSFVPMLNQHGQDNRVVMVARYETGERDQIIADFTLEANQRGGITISTPELFEAQEQLVRGNTPYSIEVRSERPIAATFSYYDLFLLDGNAAAIGEAFTNRVSDTWSFSNVVKGGTSADFLVFQNTTDSLIKVTTTLYPTDGSEPIDLVLQLDAFRRGGWNLANEPGVPDGSYGVVVRAQGEIVAAMSHYNADDGDGASAFGMTGNVGAGSVQGVIPEGQFGINSDNEVIGIVNANSSAANVQFSFLFSDGSAYRASVAVEANSTGQLSVGDLAGFPAGNVYSVRYESDVPVALTLPTNAFQEAIGSSFSDVSYTQWLFGEGFRPPTELATSVDEYLRVYNPSESDVVIEITIRYDNDEGLEVFRRQVDARQVAEFDVHSFITGTHRDEYSYYGITVKAATPIVAYMGHYDAFFPGAFGTLGTPLGNARADI